MDDLIENCREIARRAASGRIVAMYKHRQIVGHDEWVIDLALGEPAEAPKPPPDGQKIVVSAPSVIQIAAEAKSIMTEHKKARKNRLRDLNAFHEHAHRYSRNTIASGVIVINSSKYFWSPLRRESDITEHRNISRLTKETIDTFRSIPLLNEGSMGPGMEAMGVIVVEHDNLRLNPDLPTGAPKTRQTKLATAFGPAVGDPLHYATMIRRICNTFRERFC